MKLFLYILYMLFLTETSIAKIDKIYTVHGKYGDYYNMFFTLTPENCELSVPVSERTPPYQRASNKYTFTDSGQFEVFVRAKYFPVVQFGKKSKFLILRMPATIPYINSYIQEKRNLFERIKKMKNEKRGSVKVVIELNPYIAVIKKKPLIIKLDGKNIFFRQAYGQYINYTGALKTPLTKNKH